MGVSEAFGETLNFGEVYFAKKGAECVTLEKFIEGKFMKFVNNTGECCVASDGIGKT